MLKSLKPFAGKAKGIIIIICLSFLTTSLRAQNCSLEISGIATDETQEPLAGVAVQLYGPAGKGGMTDMSGRFVFDHLCPGQYRMTFTITGLKPLSKEVMLRDRDTVLRIALQQDRKHLHEVTITGKRIKGVSTLASTTLSGDALAKNQGKSLGQLLEQISGVSVMQSGPTLYKPSIHGLTGNRVLLINNGVRQEGQQWGEDHAPELDPNSAGSVTVVKGAASIRYGSDAIAGVVLMDPPSLPDSPGIAGDIGLEAASNGRKGNVTGSMEGAFDKSLKGLAWRLQGTLQRAGNFQTPFYYLDNTGMAEGSYSAQLGYHVSGLELNASYSQYNSKIGIFAGSEVGDTTDLIQAYNNRDKPLVRDRFTYDIQRGYQQINHEVMKVDAKYRLSDFGDLELSYARQKDLRQEYSSDIAYSSDPKVQNLPEDWFKLITHSLDLVYDHHSADGFSGSMGLSGETKGNVYQGLGRIPLIPNYRDYGGGAFAIERYGRGKWLLEGGLRYDYLWRQVYRYDINTLNDYHSAYDYHNLTGTLGATFDLSHHFTMDANFGMGWRAPNPEEMFINGVHASAAQFVTGDSALKSERSYNTTLSLHYKSDKLKLDADLYDNEIRNFIYAEPIGTRQILGVGYHAFQYVQDDVRLLGADISGTWDVLPVLSLTSKTSLLRATNRTRNGGLINMPPARFQNGLTLHRESLGKLMQPYFTLQNVSVLRQGYIVPDQEQLLPPPPPAYSLWNVSMGAALPVGKKQLDLSFAVENLTNKVYSDYMNQFRYFAYDLGVNFILRARFSF
ncbi:MAG TPA: TonB-dependent receptor [Edaphocola sp.]|nr:TonB-dependent receptor [Edaphocola sp.]